MTFCRFLILAILFALPVTASRADVLSEDFDGGMFPPTGWTLIDNTPGDTGWALNTDFAIDNYTGGTGVCAAIDSDAFGWGAVDAELISPVFVVPVGSTLEFDHSFRWYSGGLNEQADVDISVDGGPWENLANYSGGDDGYPTGVHKSIDLGAYGGRQAQIRFRYYDANWDWWWEVDNVTVTEPPAFELQIFNLVAGQQGAFLITGGQAYTDTFLGYSLTGPGSYWSPYLNVTIDLDDPKRLFGPKQTNENGAVWWYYQIPSGIAGWTIWFQGAQYGQTTGVVEETVR